MNGGNVNSPTSLRITPRGSDRPGSFSQLYPPGSNVRSLSNGHYFSNIQNFGNATVGTFSASLNPGPKGLTPTGPADISKSGKGAQIGTGRNFGNSLNSQSGLSRDSFAGSALYSSKTLGNLGATTAATSNSKLTSDILSTGATAAGVAKGASGVASAAAGPIGLAAQVSQSIGEAIGSTLTARDQGIASKDTEHNRQQYSIANSQNTRAIADAQNNTINNRSNGAAIGSLFGPIGALAGYFAASLMSDQNRGVFHANSFEGAIDPTDSGIAASHSTALASGQTNFKDSIHDGIPIPDGAS